MKKETNFDIMSRDVKVAVWKDGRLDVVNESLLPLYLRNFSDAGERLATRAIDSRRANSRLLKKALRLQERDDISTAVQVNGATITDTYWVKPIGSELCYADIRFDSDFFSALALHGRYESFNRAANSRQSRTPELTNIGSFEKCWKIIDGEWWMYKRADHNEQFSEIFVCELGTALGMNMALYFRGDGCVRSRDFTSGASVNFEPASTFMGDDEDYFAVVDALKALCPAAIGDYVRMIFLDTVVGNPDRHTNNFGLLRDVEGGGLISLAPNFDNNMALIARGYPDTPAPKNDILVRLLAELLAKYPEYLSYIPEVTEYTVRTVPDKINMKVRTQTVVDMVAGRYNLLREQLEAR